MTDAAHRLGAWSFTLSAAGDVEHLAFDGREVLRGLQFVVRDDAWGTIAGDREVAEVPRALADVEGTPGARFEATGSYGFPEGRAESVATLVVTPTELRYEVDVRVTGTVLTNRIGFVALHPLTLAGAPVEVRHGDGSTEVSAFPRLVSPHQPFLDLAGLAHPLPGAAGTTVDIAFEGEVFESEDQRNWSDASFKSYSRPLALPYPYELADGDLVRQAVTVRVSSTPAADETRAPDAVVRDDEGVSVAVAAGWAAPVERPRVGVMLGPDDLALGAAGRDQLIEALGVDHLRVDVEAAGDRLGGGEALARVASWPVELVVHLGPRPGEALGRLAALLREHRVRLSSVLLFDLEHPATRSEALDALRGALGTLLEGVPVAVGSDDNLAELSRNAPATVDDGGLSFALNPQVHDRRDRAVLETVEALPAMIETARSLAPAGTPIGIGALTLRPRRVIYRPGPIDRLGRDDDSVDPRQHGDFAAAWLVATLAALAAAGVDSVTAFELTGPRGVVLPGTARGGSGVPDEVGISDLVPSPAGVVLPGTARGGSGGSDEADIADLALSPAGAALAAFAGARRLGTPVVDLATDIAALPLEAPGGRSVLVANLAPRDRTIVVAGVAHPFSPYQTRLLPEGPTT
ncbi:hypothetical protein [Herbiconiux sp. A18JL235]|uniref:Uncharacterized protein n=1 Tax=Herbiconiux sp. A18JL235 TaxID=3152363 RepID=A0AB39BIG7_9MICO